MTDPKKTPLVLKITKADGSLEDALVDTDQVIVGSGPSAGVRIGDPKISSLHFMLKVDKNGVVNALDLGSESGTLLGGRKIIEPTALASGDTLQVGDCRIRVAYGDSLATDVITDPGALSTNPGQPSAALLEASRKAEEKQASDAASAKKAAEELEKFREDAESKKAEAKVETSAKVEAPAPKVEAKAEKPAAKADSSSSKKKDKKEKERQAAQAAAAPRSASGSKVVGTIGATAMLFNEELPAEETPSDGSKQLEVAQLWGDTLISIHTFKEGQEVSVGSDRNNHFHVFDPSVGQKLVLVKMDASNVQVTVPPGADVVFRSSRSQKGREQLKSEGLLTASDRGGEALKLGLHDRAMVSIGTVSFVVRWVRPQKALPVALTQTLDFYFTKVLSVTMMTAIVLFWAIRFTDFSSSALSDDLFKNASKYQKLLIVPPAEQPKKKIMDLSGVKEGAKAKGEEGKFGKKEAKKEDADPSKKGAPTLDPNKREEDRTKVAKAGLLGILGKMGDGAASNILGPGGLGTGINNALGGLKGGAGMGDAHGVGGLGSRGTGPGGGGNGLGLGGLGTKGNGHGKGGYGSIDLGGRGKDTVRVVPGKTTVVGSLSREEIERVIKRHQNEILFCYETELNKTPDLYGKVSVNFTIDGSGAVSDASAAQDTMNNNNVEQCMLTRIRRWRFPEPKGGGVVVVTYPWVFHSADGKGDD